MFDSHRRLFATPIWEGKFALRAESPRRSAALCENCPLKGRGEWYNVGDKVSAAILCSGINPDSGKGIFRTSLYGTYTDGTYTDVLRGLDNEVGPDARCGIQPGNITSGPQNKEVEI